MTKKLTHFFLWLQRVELNQPSRILCIVNPDNRSQSMNPKYLVEPDLPAQTEMNVAAKKLGNQLFLGSCTIFCSHFM